MRRFFAGTAAILAAVLFLTLPAGAISAEKAILEETDIHSESMTVNRSMFRKFVGDTDAGQEMKETIKDLEKLLEAYRSGELSERL